MIRQRVRFPSRRFRKLRLVYDKQEASTGAGTRRSLSLVKNRLAL